MSELNLVAINLTRRCNLACKHCYLDATVLKEGLDNELSTHEVMSILDELKTMNRDLMVVLTGGEPLLRDDLEEIVKYGSQLGLFLVVPSNVVFLNHIQSCRRNMEILFYSDNLQVIPLHYLNSKNPYPQYK